MTRAFVRGTLAALVLAGTGTAAADRPELGGFLGPRIFADDSSLGDNPDHPEFETSIANAVVFGGRLGVPLWSWLVPEVEVAISPAASREHDLSITWIATRVQARLQWSEVRLRPFALLGFAVPAAFSSNTSIFPNGISYEGYGGGGLLWSPGRGVSLRLEARVALGPARASADGSPVAVEGEIAFGVWVPIGKAPPPPPTPPPPPSDRDGDTVIDADDRCPDRPEDKDDVGDDDGCPDIDDDGDQVLDIADRCPTIAELYNGFDDDDGCPDSTPASLSELIGPLDGLVYAEGETRLGADDAAALEPWAAALRQYPSVRVVITGHADDREAAGADAGDAVGGADNSEEPREAARSLGLARAAAVRDALVARGVGRGRVDLASGGAEDPRADNGSSIGRRRNRRVEVQLFVPRR